MMGVPKLAMTLFYLAYLAATFTSLHRAKYFRIKTTCDVHEHGKSLNGLCEKKPGTTAHFTNDWKLRRLNSAIIEGNKFQRLSSLQIAVGNKFYRGYWNFKLPFFQPY
jgi:hypothetical protein